MSIGRQSCYWEQHSKEGKTRECPWAGGAATTGNIQRSKERHECPLAEGVVNARNIKTEEDT
jgi:hypothetical protein